MLLREIILERIRRCGPLTFAEFMDTALYHPKLGYYARVDRRSGRAGDFFTSVDTGPLFGELLANQFAEMWAILETVGLNLIEAGAGSGQLARDILDAAAITQPTFYSALQLRLIERSPTARRAQRTTLQAHSKRLTRPLSSLPKTAYCGVIFANELLDALPTHSIVMTHSGLREIFIDAKGDRLIEKDGPLSSSNIQTYIDRLGVRLQPGWRAEVNLSARNWIREAARRLKRGFLLIIDYGYEAKELYSATHAAGTLATYHRHVVESIKVNTIGDTTAPWLIDPGEHDITSHVDITSIKQAALEEGMECLGLLDQTYFLMGLGITDRLAPGIGGMMSNLKQRLAAKTLLLPGGLGSTHKVLILGKDVGKPRLRSCSYKMRVT